MFGGTQAVSWRDYDGVDGFGAATEEDLSALLKALTAGQDVNNPGSSPGAGFPLRVESLERTLRNTTFRMENVRLFKQIPKLAAFNTVEEYNRISEYGANIDAFIDEGDLPSETDATYSREVSIVKYLGTTRRVTHVMSLVRPAHGNVIAQETVNGTMYLLRALERAMFYGNAALDPIQYDGFVSLINQFSPSANIIDLRGAALAEENLIDSALTIQDAPNFGTPTHLYTAPKVKADLVKTFFPKSRYDLMEKKDGMVGLDINGFTSPAGDIRFEPDVFIDAGQGSGSGAVPAAAIGPAATRPSTPTISAALTTPVNAASQFGASDVGSYRYQVVAANRFGKSIPVVVTGSPVAVAAGDDARFDVDEGAVPASWYEVYRSEKNGAAGTEKLIQRVNRTGVTTTVIDLNADLPGTTIAIMFQMNLEAVSFKQLAPMVKIPLSTVDTSIRWMQLVYGVPVLYTPGKIVLIKNIGRSPDFVGQP